MKFTEKKIIALFLATSLSILAFLGGYYTLKKEKISLIVKGQEVKVSTFKKTVKELLSENNINYDKDDIITPSLSSQVKDYMEIKVVEVTEKKLTQKEDIPYNVKVVDDKNLLKGKTKVSQEGKSGEKEKIYNLTYHDGKLIKKSLEEEKISKEPVDKIVNKGIKEEIIVASRSLTSRNSNVSQNKKHMVVQATAYTGDSITSTGTVPKWGTIAVDPKVIPYGTRVYIPQFDKTFIAEDCGGAVKGNIIDIFMGSRSECYKWGRRTIDIYIN